MKSFFADSGKKKIFFIPLSIFIVILIAEITGILILNSGLIVYTTDDAYIHLALAENILKGHYGVNLQENSSPSSSVLWPFILSPFTGFSLGYLIPLLINVLSSVGSIFIFFFILKKIFFKEPTDNSILIKVAILLMILLIIGTNLVGSLFSGMEHSLQIYLTLLNIWGLILIVTDKNIPKWFLAFIIIAPLIRFENLALSFSSLIFLYLTGYKKKALFSFLIIVLSVSCFSIFLLSLGLKPLPLSVLQKSSVISSSGFYAILENVKENLFSPRGSLLMIGVFVLSYFSFFTERNRAERLLAGCFSLAVLLHLVIGKEGRYIVYIWAASLFIFIFLYREWIFKTITKIGFLKTALFSSTLTVLVSYYYILSILTIPISSNNIYEQHYQMHRFVSDYYKNYAIDVINKTIKSNVPHYILKSCDHIPWIFIEGSVKEIKIVFYNFEIKLFRSDEYTHISKYFPLYLNVMLTVFIDVYILIDYIDEINCKMCNINYMREYSQHIIHRTPFRTLHIMDYEENIHKYNFNAFAYLGQLENPPQQLIELLKPVECMSEKNKFLLYTS